MPAFFKNFSSNVDFSHAIILNKYYINL